MDEGMEGLFWECSKALNNAQVDLQAAMQEGRTAETAVDPSVCIPQAAAASSLVQGPDESDQGRRPASQSCLRRPLSTKPSSESIVSPAQASD